MLMVLLLMRRLPMATDADVVLLRAKLALLCWNAAASFNDAADAAASAPGQGALTGKHMSRCSEPDSCAAITTSSGGVGGRRMWRTCMHTYTLCCMQSTICRLYAFEKDVLWTQPLGH